MKKFLSVMLTAALALGLCSCASSTNSSSDAGSAADNSAVSSDAENSGTAEEGTSTEGGDWAYIADKGNFIAGITLFEPMNYYDENGELTGFETEFTKAVCEKLGVEAKFQEIEWDKKEIELNAKTIDAIWNGLTVTEERKENMAFSTPYVRNKQVIVIKTNNADKFKNIESMAGASCVAESGSAGQTAIEENAVLSQNTFIGASAQKDALLEVKSGTADIAVIDYVMATASIGPDTDYSDLMIVDGIDLVAEEYAIGLRKNDTETLAKINGAIDELVADGTLKKLAEKYGLADVYAFN